MSGRLYLVRHAPAAWPESLDGGGPRYRGRSDAPLSPAGRLEARTLGKRFLGERLDAVFASDLRRAVETAERLAGGTPVREVPDLAEYSFGLWEGRSHEELLREGSPEYRAWLEDPFSVAPPKGETFREFAARVEAAMEEPLRTARDGRVALVGHGGPLRLALGKLLGLPRKNGWRLRLDRSGVSVVEWAGELPVLCLLNDLSHLQSPDRGAGR